MVRPFIMVEKIIERISTVTEEAENTPDAPVTINVTDAKHDEVYTTAKQGYIIQNQGADDVYMRINGDAGTGDGQYHVRIEADVIISDEGKAIGKLSFICATGKTAKIAVTTWESV